MIRSVKSLISFQILCVILLFCTSVQAQFSGGIRAGANLADEKYPGFTMQNALLPYGGAFLQYQVNQLGFQVEADYSAEGGNLKAAFGGQVNKYRESYLNVPLFIQGRFPWGGYVEFGPQYGFLLSSNYNFNNTGEVNTKGIYKSFNLSIGGGLGYEFKQPSLKGIGINLRFMQGLTAISQSGHGDSDIKTSAFSLGLSLKI